MNVYHFPHFSNKKLRNCSFNNYRSFWQCSYDENTTFYECNFFNLNYEKLDKSIKINVDKIINPTCDEDFRHFLKQNPLYKSSHEEIKQEFLKEFLRVFIKSGNVCIITDDRIKSEGSESLSQSLINRFNKIKNKYFIR